MPRYIDAEIAQKFFRTFAASKEIKPFTKIDWDTAYRVAADSIDDIPTADVAPIVNGEWIKMGNEVFICSVCDELESVQTPYCPICGAKMYEEDKK